MNDSHKHFSNKECKYYPCHQITEDLNCLFCYCPMYFIQCPGEYELLSEGRKDCTDCTLPHERGGWELVQNVMKKPKKFIIQSKCNDIDRNA